jgi:Ras-related protein Rab-32
LGVDFLTFSFELNNSRFHIQLWDIAGHERFFHLLRVYYKNAVGAFVMFDLTDYKSFDSVPKWKKGIDEKVFLSNGNPIPCILLANKNDLVNNFDDSSLESFSKDEGFCKVLRTSVKENFGLEEAIISMVENIPTEINVVKEIDEFPDCVIIDKYSIQQDELKHNGCCK